MIAKKNTDQKSQLKKTYQPPREVNDEHKVFMTNLGNNLQELRKSKNMSVFALVKELGMSRNTYTQIEKGQVYFNFLNLLIVLDYHGITPEEFFKKI